MKRFRVAINHKRTHVVSIISGTYEPISPFNVRYFPDKVLYNNHPVFSDQDVLDIFTSNKVPIIKMLDKQDVITQMFKMSPKRVSSFET